MNTGDSSYTGCAEAYLESDEGVRKMTERTSASSLSNQIHIWNRGFQRKPWKSGPSHQLSLQRRLNNESAFSAGTRILFWKTRNKIFPAIYIPDAHQHRPVPD